MGATSKIAIALSLLSVAISLFAVAARPAPVSEARVEKPRVEAPPTEPDLIGKCGKSPAATTTKELMRDHMNLSMTRIAFALHHDQTELSERMDTVAACASKLLDGVRVSPSLKLDVPIESLPAYYAMLDDLQRNSHALKVAALEGDHADALHWYSHVKQDCIACHARFRKE